MDKRIDAVFSYLDLWRHLPAYQLERRADIFFAAYMPEILRSRFGVAPTHILPEFPLHKATLDPKVQGNKSFKVDYLAVLPAPHAPVLIELKTDPSSRRSSQDTYLSRASELGLAGLLPGLQKIYEATNAKRKYDALLSELETAGLIKLLGPGQFEVLAEARAAQVLYIQPNPDTSPSVLHFAQIADLLDEREDAFSQRFALSLREWASVEAGSRPQEN